MPGDSTILYNQGERIPGSKEDNSYFDFLGGVLVVVALAYSLRRLSARIESYYNKKKIVTYNEPAQNDSTQNDSAQPDEPVVERLIYDGKELQFPTETLKTVLSKYFPYYNSLSVTEQSKFLYRLEEFIERKTFVIHDSKGFREMPILLSASAVKLSFGLQNYLLPHYKYIHVFPAEFIGTIPSIRVLAGNVSGNSIHVSWKHFMEGLREPHDGQDLGLHEMAHAYYFQNVALSDGDDEYFAEHFDKFNLYGNKVYEALQPRTNNLYTEYALKNFQEFWAESVELFFEKPVALKTTYPELFNCMVQLLNQDPVAHINGGQISGSNA